MDSGRSNLVVGVAPPPPSDPALVKAINRVAKALEKLIPSKKKRRE